MPQCVERELLEKIHDTIKLPDNKKEKREYQFRGAIKALEQKRALLEHGTGAGKTITVYMMMNYLLLHKNIRKILFIVPTLTLLEQAYNDFKEYGFNVDKFAGKYYSEEKTTDRNITFATWQSACKNDKLLASVEAVIVDETHQAKATEISELMKKCLNANYRIGVTGTLPDWETDKYTVIGCFGPVADVITSDELIHKEKVLSPVEIKVLNLYYPKELSSGIPDYQTERRIIEAYEIRKNLVKSVLINKCHNQNTIVLFDKKDSFGREYFEYIKPYIPDATFYWIAGEIKGEDRERIRKLTNLGKHVILFGTLGTISTGLNIPKIHNIIFLYIGKSLIRVKQSIGRGLRKHDEKELATIYDIADNLKYSKAHLIERLKIYAKEGYPVEIFDIGKKGKK